MIPINIHQPTKEGHPIIHRLMTLKNSQALARFTAPYPGCVVR